MTTFVYSWYKPMNTYLKRLHVPDSFKIYHPLTDIEISQFCKLNKIPLNGIYMRGDKMKYKTGCYTFNHNGENDDPGTHWVCAYVSVRKNSYFDPFGMMPSNGVKTFLKQKNKDIDINIIPVQDIKTDSCGYFCCIALYLLSHRQSFYSIIHELFGFDTNENEQLLRQIFKIN